MRSTLQAGYLAFTEVMAYDVNGVLLTASASVSGRDSVAAPAPANASSFVANYGPELANDMAADTYYNSAWFQSQAVNASSGQPQWWQVLFPRPAQVASVYVHQKKGSSTTYVNAMVAAGATVELLSLSGGVMASRSVASTGYVATAVFANYSTSPAPFTPGSVAEVNASAFELASMVRYVQIQCAVSALRPGSVLIVARHFDILRFHYVTALSCLIIICSTPCCPCASSWCVD